MSENLSNINMDTKAATQPTLPEQMNFTKHANFAVYTPENPHKDFSQALKVLSLVLPEVSQEFEKRLENALHSGNPRPLLTYPGMVDDLKAMGWLKPQFEFGSIEDLSKNSHPFYPHLKSKYNLAADAMILNARLPAVIDRKRVQAIHIPDDVRAPLPIAALYRTSVAVIRRISVRAETIRLGFRPPKPTRRTLFKPIL